MTATLPGATDAFGEPAGALQTYPGPISGDLWLGLIDGDHSWRQDSQNRLSELYHFRDVGSGNNAAQWVFTGLTPGAMYQVQTNWRVNEAITDQGRRPPAKAAHYEVFTGVIS